MRDENEVYLLLIVVVVFQSVLALAMMTVTLFVKNTRQIQARDGEEEMKKTPPEVFFFSNAGKFLIR